MMQAVRELAVAILGTFGFAMVYRVQRRHLPATAFAGFLGWAVYLIFYALDCGLFLSNLLGAAAVYAWSEFMARMQKAPVTIFLLPGIVPMLPGGQLYYALRAMLEKNLAGFQEHGVNFVMITLGMACGVVAASVISCYLFSALHRRKLHQGE